MTFEHVADVAGPSTGDDKSIYKSNSEEVFVTGSGDHDAVYGVGGVGHTHRRLKARHVTFIGFGGGIGTGLFVGTGSALASAGPLGLLLAYSVVGLILWCVMESVGEIATLVSFNSILMYNGRPLTMHSFLLLDRFLVSQLAS
jgi:amino acid transporter